MASFRCSIHFIKLLCINDPKKVYADLLCALFDTLTLLLNSAHMCVMLLPANTV
ncbi:hypothetical protein GMOD_00004017 [Pyrenophora seminiperda CCB06]|uniref:Uncharacterized protein n=1 Tax=Pyrenophora seminiperda CCB06 TaxID=1302712 RepID=A0A3M7M0E6_9PLEO|nr:hypothetical protein GMOD_00004017 [Pyrenophora seminiperda CCB06]